MNYGALISESFWLALRNPFLWFFGFFLYGGTPFGFNSSFPTGSNDLPSQPNVPPPAWVMNPERWFYDNLGLVLAIAALVVLLILVLISLTILSEGALIESIAALHRGEPRRFSSAFRAGLSNFWRVLGQRVLLLLISLALSLLVFVPVVLLFLVFFSSADPESIGLMFLLVFLGLLLAIPLLILVLVPVYIIGQLALRELVLGGRRVFGSIGSGYEIFRRNRGGSLVVWVIQAAIALGVFIVLFVVSLVVGLVQLTLALAFTGYETTVAVALGLILAIPSIVLSGAVGTFNSGYWTLAYLQLTASPPPAMEPYGSPNLG